MIVLLAILLAVTAIILMMKDPSSPDAAAQRPFLPSAPEGLLVKLWAEAPAARSLALSPDGRTLFVGTRKGIVYRIPVSPSQQAERVEIFQDGLNGSNGLCFVGQDLFVAELLRVVRYSSAAQQPLQSKGEVVLEGLPNEKHHGWRYLKAGPDGRLMISIGAPCNVCLRPDDPRFASICSFHPDGSDFRVEAHGVRNSVGFDWHPKSGDFYFTDNGRDMLGDDIPPCELNVLPRGESDRHYGFPYFWGDNQRDADISSAPPKREFYAPLVGFQAHTAPLGCYFPRHARWSKLLGARALVAQHGSWNRSRPVGYQVVSVDVGRAGGDVQPFLSGFMVPEGDRYPVWGRPVDITELEDGTLLVSDDHGGKIWAVTPRI